MLIYSIAQLDAVVRNLIQTSLGEKITLDDVKRVLNQYGEVQHSNNGLAEPVAADNTVPPTIFDQPLRESRDEFERLYFAHHMKNVAGNMSKLAEIVGLERTHLYRKLKQLDIKIKG